MFPTFRWGLTGRGDYSFVPSTEPVIVSAMSLYTHGAWKRTEIRMARWPDWALDSGGFVALRKAGEYPFTPDEYLAFVERTKPVWAASMDYPCEPELCAGMGTTVEENIAATVELARYLCVRSERIVPVVQGFTADQYEACWSRLPKTGRVAVGSVCRRQSLPEIRELVRRLREFIDAPFRHGFGIKLKALQYADVVSFFTSVDSNAWEFAVMAQRHELKHLRFQERLRWAFERYEPKVAALRNAPRQGVLL